ncbi:MAG: hydrogenase maturation nickel metallochaperone HypA [Syntrophales bacterium]
MHELYLAESIIDIIDDYALKHGFRRVRSIKLSFGSLSCINTQSLEFAFSVQSRNTRAEGASLEFEITPARVLCLSCSEETDADSLPEKCPRCGGTEIMLKDGKEDLRLVEMDVE